jgi:hypothetical protein
VTKKKGRRKAKPGSSKRKTKQTKLDRLLEQGAWVALQMTDGSSPCRFMMPTDDLQAELDKELDKSIKKRLKADGFELLHATRREHPFHSAILRERIDHLADELSREHRDYSTDARAEATRQDLLTLIEDTKHHIVPMTEDDIDWVVDTGRKDALRAWARAIGQYREYLRDKRWWKNTYVERALNPPDGPPLPNKLPHPVYVSKQSEIVLSLQGGFVHLYTRITALVGSA